ncbi:MAG: hypothetical protein ABI425_01395 [Patescibacteria group bacterium]
MPQLHSLHTVSPIKQPVVRSDYLPAGIASAFCFVVLIWILFSVSPGEIRDILFPSSFLPVILAFFICSSCGLLFVTLNVRRAVMWASCLTILVWLQFQHVLNIGAFIYIIFPFAFLETILTVLRER